MQDHPSHPHKPTHRNGIISVYRQNETINYYIPLQHRTLEENMNRALQLQRVWSHSPKELATSQQQHTRRPISLTQSTSRFLPPQLIIFLAMVSLQLGAAFAKSIFP